jgi:hypothetical protein
MTWPLAQVAGDPSIVAFSIAGPSGAAPRGGMAEASGRCGATLWSPTAAVMAHCGNLQILDAPDWDRHCGPTTNARRRYASGPSRGAGAAQSTRIATCERPHIRVRVPTEETLSG